MKKLTIIVPLHEYNEELLGRALRSIEVSEKNLEYYQVLFVGPKTICKKAQKLLAGISKIENSVLDNNETDFATQINKSVFDCVTPYFTILEYDDKFLNGYLEFVQEYIGRHGDYSVILPVNEYVNTDDEVLSFCNEIGLDISFVNEIGKIGLEELEVFMDFNCTGGIFKTEDFIALGCLKKSLKIASWYEFLLRSAYNGKQIYIIPKIGYSHTIGREGSYMVSMKNSVSQDEGHFLIERAKGEYMFKEDKNLEFVQKDSEDKE